MLYWLVFSGLSCTRGDDVSDDSDTTPPVIIEGTPSFYDARPKNVLAISMDTLRRDYFMRYGGTQDATPYMDKLAEEGFVMDRHRSCSDWTHAGTLCALNAVDNVDFGYPPQLTDSLPMLGERPTFSSVLRDLGYQTILVTANSWLTRFNIQYGYDSAETYSVHADAIWEYARNTLTDLQISDPSPDDPPWLVHIHIKEPHVAYAPPDQYLEGLEDLPPIDYDLTESDTHYEVTNDFWDDMSQEEKDLVTQHMLVRYLGEVRYMDDLVKGILQDADDFGLLEDTLVVFWTDHGEQFWEHGDQSHAYSLYSEENDSVFLLWSNNILPGTWAENTTHIDIVPTVLAALGQPIPEELQGLPVGTADPDRPLHASTIARNGTLLSVTQGNDRLIYNFNGTKELYDLAKDPGEQTNLYDAKDPKVSALWEELTPKVDAMYKIVPQLGAPTDPGP